MQNNSSSTMPFIPSSTSYLSAHQNLDSSPSSSATGYGLKSLNVVGKVTWQQPPQSLHQKQMIAGVHLHKRSNSVTKRNNIGNWK